LAASTSPSCHESPFATACAARCKRSASSGLMIQPFAPLRRAKCTSALRSSNINTGTFGMRWSLWSSRRSMVTAIAPIEPICKSRTATSGVRVAMASGTSRPLRQTVNDVSGEPSAARTSSRTHWASVASKICTG